MPIGATIGAAVVGAGATIGAGAMASHATSKAAQTASNDATAAATMNNQLARDTYTANAARLDPYSAMGLDAGDEYTGLLLGPSATRQSSGYVPTASPSALATVAAPSGPSLDQILAEQHDGIPGNFKRDLASFSASRSALNPVVAQQAQQAIASGADPAAVRARAAQFGVTI